MRGRKYTWKRVGFLVAFAAFFLLMGFAVRFAEDSQVGYTNDFSMWVFVVAGLFAYSAGLMSFVLWRRR